jgi:hypothetical protein
VEELLSGRVTRSNSKLHTRTHTWRRILARSRERKPEKIYCMCVPFKLLVSGPLGLWGSRLSTHSSTSGSLRGQNQSIVLGLEKSSVLYIVRIVSLNSCYITIPQQNKVTEINSYRFCSFFECLS